MGLIKINNSEIGFLEKFLFIDYESKIINISNLINQNNFKAT